MTKISQMTSAVSISTAFEAPIIDGGANYRASASQLATGLAGALDHAQLNAANLDWLNSGHTGAVGFGSFLCGTDTSGAAAVFAEGSYEKIAKKGVANGYASLDSGGKIPSAQIPAYAISEALGTVADETEMLALSSAEPADWCVRTDTSSVWILTGTDPSVLGDWTEFTYPSGAGVYQPLDADLTAIAALTGTNTLYYRSAAGTWTAVTIGSGLSFTSGTLSATGGSVDVHASLTNRTAIIHEVDLTNMSTGSTGSGTNSASSPRRAYVSSGTTASSSACRNYHNQAEMGWSCGSDYRIIDWDSEISLSVEATLAASTTNGIARFYFGGDNVTTVQDMPTKGIGFSVKNSALYGVCRNGGSLVEVDLSISLSTSVSCNFTAHSDGAGNVTWYVDGSSVGTSSSGPTGAGASTESAFHMSADNGGDAVAQSLFVHGAKVLVST